jgi:cytochrome P450
LDIGNVDMYISLNTVFFRSLYRFMFGFKLDDSELKEVMHVIHRLEEFSAVIGFVPARLLPLYRVFRKDRGLFERLQKIVDNIMLRVVAPSPLSDLIDSPDVNRQQVKDTVKNLLFAGATTAANSLGWAIYRVSLDDHLAQMAAEAADATHIEFFKNVCLEANRIYPQANVVTRRTINPDKVAGYDIPKNTILVIPIIALHLSETFDNPKTFDPSRWNGKIPSLMTYIPFTAGPRQCIGQPLFNRVGPLLLARVFSVLSFRPLHNDVEPRWPNAVLPPRKGFKMLIKQRVRSVTA